MQTTSITRSTGPVPNADPVREALLALDELIAAGRDLKAARIFGGDTLVEATARFNRALATSRILTQEANEHEQVAA